MWLLSLAIMKNRGNLFYPFRFAKKIMHAGSNLFCGGLCIKKIVELEMTSINGYVTAKPYQTYEYLGLWGTGC